MIKVITYVNVLALQLMFSFWYSSVNHVRSVIVHIMSYFEPCYGESFARESSNIRLFINKIAISVDVLYDFISLKYIWN